MSTMSAPASSPCSVGTDTIEHNHDTTFNLAERLPVEILALIISKLGIRQLTSLTTPSPHALTRAVNRALRTVTVDSNTDLEPINQNPEALRFGIAGIHVRHLTFAFPARAPHRGLPLPIRAHGGLWISKVLRRTPHLDTLDLHGDTSTLAHRVTHLTLTDVVSMSGLTSLTLSVCFSIGVELLQHQPDLSMVTTLRLLDCIAFSAGNAPPGGQVAFPALRTLELWLPTRDAGRRLGAGLPLTPTNEDLGWLSQAPALRRFSMGHIMDDYRIHVGNDGETFSHDPLAVLFEDNSPFRLSRLRSMCVSELGLCFPPNVAVLRAPRPARAEPPAGGAVMPGRDGPVFVKRTRFGYMMRTPRPGDPVAPAASQVRRPLPGYDLIADYLSTAKKFFELIPSLNRLIFQDTGNRRFIVYTRVILHDDTPHAQHHNIIPYQEWGSTYEMFLPDC